MANKERSPYSARLHLPLSSVIALALAAGALAPTSSAQAQYGPYTCVNGLVWREAVPNDFVCVNAPTRKTTQDENALGPSLRQPGGGASGPDTCKQGYVWRETRPSDHVCVSPPRRDINHLANTHAHTGYAHPEQLPSNSTVAGWRDDGNGFSQLFVRPPNLAFHSWEPGIGYDGVGFGNFGTSEGERAVTPRRCKKSTNRSIYVLAVDEVTGIVSNAGHVAVPACN